jgi:hypothetical protein
MVTSPYKWNILERDVKPYIINNVLCRSVWAFADRSKSLHCLWGFINNRCLPCNTFSYVILFYFSTISLWLLTDLFSPLKNHAPRATPITSPACGIVDGETTLRNHGNDNTTYGSSLYVDSYLGLVKRSILVAEIFAGSRPDNWAVDNDTVNLLDFCIVCSMIFFRELLPLKLCIFKVKT